MMKIFPLLSVRKHAFDLELLTVATAFRMRIVDLPIRIYPSMLFSMSTSLECSWTWSGSPTELGC